MEEAYRNMEIEHARAFGAARRGMEELGQELLETRTELAAAKTEADRVRESLHNAERFVGLYSQEAAQLKRDAADARAELNTTAERGYDRSQLPDRCVRS